MRRRSIVTCVGRSDNRRAMLEERCDHDCQQLGTRVRRTRFGRSNSSGVPPGNPVFGSGRSGPDPTRPGPVRAARTPISGVREIRTIQAAGLRCQFPVGSIRQLVCRVRSVIPAVAATLAVRVAIDQRLTVKRSPLALQRQSAHSFSNPILFKLPHFKRHSQFQRRGQFQRQTQSHTK